jgi:hypothetical protein
MADLDKARNMDSIDSGLNKPLRQTAAAMLAFRSSKVQRDCCC